MAYREDQTVPGFVYAMRSINAALSNEIKVGLTLDPEERRRTLSGTSMALPFAFERVWAVSNMALAEDIAHTMLEHHRINSSREHFSIVPVDMLKGVFDSLWHEPSDEELDICLQALLDRIESKFAFHSAELRWYVVDCDTLPAYSRGLSAWEKGRAGAHPPAPLF